MAKSHPALPNSCHGFLRASLAHENAIPTTRICIQATWRTPLEPLILVASRIVLLSSTGHLLYKITYYRLEEVADITKSRNRKLSKLWTEKKYFPIKKERQTSEKELNKT